MQYEAVFLQLFACHSNHANEHRGLRHDLERGDERSTSIVCVFHVAVHPQRAVDAEYRV